MMTLKTAALAAALALGGFSAIGFAPAAHAGDVSNAQMVCYVDTYAYDQDTPDYCASYWTPGSATNPTHAVFTAVGTSQGQYHYSWLDVERGNAPCGNVSSCAVPIATETRGDGQAHLRVTITDTATGARKTVEAIAEYYDAWN